MLERFNSRPPAVEARKLDFKSDDHLSVRLCSDVVWKEAVLDLAKVAMLVYNATAWFLIKEITSISTLHYGLLSYGNYLVCTIMCAIAFTGSLFLNQ